MKHLLLGAVIRRLQTDARFRKKLKLFAVVGVVGFFLTTGLVIWAGVSALHFAGKQLNGVDIQSQVENIESKLNAFPEVTTETCWSEAQSLFNLDVWISKPFADNIRSLKIACFETKQQA